MLTKLMIGTFLILATGSFAHAAIGCNPGDCCNGHPCGGPPDTGDRVNDDKAIYDALKAPEFGLPTAFPYSGFEKIAGRLVCTHMTNVQTLEQSYSCLLK